MRSKFYGRLMVLSAVLMLVLGWMVALGAGVHPLGVEEMSRWGATHCVVIKATDLTTTTTNTIQTITNVFNVNSNQYVELVAMKLETPFSYSATNAFNSVKVQCGDGNSTNRYLSFTEICEYGAFKKIAVGTAPSLTLAEIAGIGGTNTLTNCTYNAGAKLTYTSADTVDFIFMPYALYGLDSLDKGEVRFYFRVLDAY